jgi:hypothetical protein
MADATVNASVFSFIRPKDTLEGAHLAVVALIRPLGVISQVGLRYR